MRNFRIIIVILTLILSAVSYAQNGNGFEAELKSNNSLYIAFNKFYKDKIRQEKKDISGEPYFFKMDQLNGIHYVDYNEDGIKDVLIEFSASQSNKTSSNFLVAVLFENSSNNFKYRAHFNPNNSLFKEYIKPYFIFSGQFRSFTEGVMIEKIKLVGNNFIKY